MKRILFIACTCSAAMAQWPDSSEMNLGICTANGEQAITKLVSTADGGCYVSWFDNRGGGYDVFMQRLNASGEAQWETNGILIADRGYSSVMDFGLTVDSSGNAVVTYRNDVASGDTIEVSAVNTAGTILWTTTVQNGGPFVASPVITTVDDGVIVGWINDEDSKFQKLHSDGNLAWLAPLTMSDPAGGSLYVADLHPSLDGSVIASFVQYTTFWGTKVLKAQRISGSGSTMWVGLVSVMLDNSLQMGAYPDFVSDNNGGGFFTWYGVNPLQCYATRISSNGMMWFAGQVQVASGFGSTLRVEPVGVRAGNEFVVFFRMLDANQSSDGIGAQRFSINGNLMWGDTGVVLKPISNLQAYGSLTASYTNDGSFVAFTQSPSFGNDVIVAASIDQYGLPMWDTYFVNVATTPSSKSRAVAINADGGVVLAWQDDRSGANDIYGQRMNSDGSLGNSASCNADLDGDGNVGVSDLLQVIDAWGICGISCPEDIDSDGFVGVTDLLMMIDGWGDC